MTRKCRTQLPPATRRALYKIPYILYTCVVWYHFGCALICFLCACNGPKRGWFGHDHVSCAQHSVQRSIREWIFRVLARKQETIYFRFDDFMHVKKFTSTRRVSINSVTSVCIKHIALHRDARVKSINLVKKKGYIYFTMTHTTITNPKITRFVLVLSSASLSICYLPLKRRRPGCASKHMLSSHT